MLSDKNLLFERPHPSGTGGKQRIYRFSDGHGLSLVNMPMAHCYSFAWEAAVLENVSEDGSEFSLAYDTPMTSDVEVFSTDKQANAFIGRARRMFDGK